VRGRVRVCVRAGVSSFVRAGVRMMTFIFFAISSIDISLSSLYMYVLLLLLLLLLAS